MSIDDVFLELAKSGLAVVTGLISASALTFHFLRHQEKAKREEELKSELREIRYKALIEAIEGLGKCPVVAAWNLESAPGERDDKKVQTTFDDFLILLATKEFLIGSDLFQLIRKCLEDIAHAKESQELDTLTNKFELELQYWIPPLKRLND
jgi:hypothetical protein